MNPQLTEIAFVLDRSGSMKSIQNETIAGFNRFLSDQQELPGEARLTLVLFDDRIETPVNAVPVQEVAALNSDTYLVRNTTALLDAIGLTIHSITDRLALTPEPERPGKVIVAILTDGLENASQRFNMKDINRMIGEKRERDGWVFLFLGANQDAIATAAQMGIDRHHSATWCCNGDGVMAGHASISRKSSAIRRSAMNMATPEDVADLNRSSEEILREEEEKRRGPS